MSDTPIPTKENILTRLNETIPITSIVDVGVRASTHELIKCFPTHKQYLFEPVNLFFNNIKKNYKNINYELFPFALANKESRIFLVLTSLEKNGVVTHSRISTEKIEVDHVDIISCDEMEVKRFESLELSKNIESDFLLKVDVDGEDLNVIKGFGSKLKLASAVIIECTCISATERIAYLQQNNFVLIDMVDLVYYGLSLYQFDAVLVRKDLITRNYNQ
ncbi:MAG: FkbM family methyltransferase [Cocleimonas sp.]